MFLLLLPPIWLLIVIVGLPQLSETVYTPSLPEIAKALQTTVGMVENTLTIYLFAFAIGTLFWGRISDTYGRRHCVIMGLLIFIKGCIICYMSTTITGLLCGRFVQAFGGSIGSVLGQAICRDAFHGPELGKIFAIIGSALALFPALGPTVGGIISQNFGWPSIFLFLIILAVLITFLTVMYLPETLIEETRLKTSIYNVATQLIKDRRVIGLGLIVAGCNGILFSYFAEGSFFFIEYLKLTPTMYGTTFIAIAISTMAGGLISKWLHSFYTGIHIMKLGLAIIFFGALFQSILVLTDYYYYTIPSLAIIVIIIILQMFINCGICMATTNALATALIDYKWCIGTASSLFGFFYYCLISLCTLGIALLHDGSLRPMPLYFLVLALSMICIDQFILVRK